jgi:hypothetical protein
MQVPEQIAAAQVERMMKFQEVILKAAAGKLKWWEVESLRHQLGSGSGI